MDSASGDHEVRLLNNNRLRHPVWQTWIIIKEDFSEAVHRAVTMETGLDRKNLATKAQTDGNDGSLKS